MVIQCAHCQTRFKLADDKLKPEGTKVRCSKCREIFSVFPPAPEDSPPAPELPAAMEAAAPPPPAPAPPATASDEMDFGDFGMPAPDPGASEEGFSFDDGSDLADSSGEEPEFSVSPGMDAGSDLDEFSFEMEDINQGSDFAPPAPEHSDTGDFTMDSGGAGGAADEFSFEEETSAGDFDDFSLDATEPAQTATGFTPDATVAGEFALEDSTTGDAADEFSFGEDAAATGFGEFSFDESEEGTGDSAGSADEFSFGDGAPADFSWEGDDTAEDAFGFEESPATTDTPPSGAVDEFDFSGLTFGEEESPAAPLEAPTAPRPSAEPQPTRAAAETRNEEREIQEKPKTKEKVQKSKDTKSKAPRRKSAMGVLVKLLILLLVALCGAAGYFYLNPGIIDIQQTIGDLIGKQITSQQPPGQIRIEGLSGNFVTNAQNGELFVIRGRAINEFKQNRSAIAVKAVLFNQQGKVLGQKIAFCGNPLDDATLHNASFESIQEAMGNQFGNALSNLNVAAGKALPFTIVFKNLPADLAEFTVEASDSQPGSK